MEGVSLTVEPHERVALVAPSGRGKTTLCRILAGYERPQAGTVTVDGQPLPGKGRCPVQLIGQHPELFFDPRMTLEASLAEAGTPRNRENVSSLPVASSGGAKRRSREISCDKPVLHHLLERFDVKEEWLSRYPSELSGGELQRLCIVRALVAEPRYLVADEMSVMLDAITQARIWHELLAEAEQRDMGIVLVSHSPALTGRIATNVVRL